MVRKKYTAGQKVSTVNILEQRQSDNPQTTVYAVARDLGLDCSQLKRWQEQVEDHKKKTTRTPGIHYNPKACSLHCGRKSCLHPIENDLIQYIDQQRDQGISVTIQMVTDLAKRLDGRFRAKTDRAQDQAVRRFVASNHLRHRVHKYQPKKAPRLCSSVSTNETTT
jgi:hypothetical protein